MLAAWKDYVPDPDHARDVVEEATRKASDEAQRLARLSERECAEALADAAAEGFRIVAIVDPKKAAAAIVSPALDRARAWLEHEPSPSRAAVAGVLASANLVLACGRYVDGHYDFLTQEGLAREIHWLETAARLPPSTPDVDRLLGFAAFGCGRSGLALGFTNDEALARLVETTKQPPEATWRALVAFVTAFPAASHSYAELGFVARAYVTHLQKRLALATVGPWLHRLVHEGPGPMPAFVTDATPPPVEPPKPPRIEASPELVARVAAFLAPDDRMPSRAPPFTSFTMTDMHGLWGGHSISIDARGAIEVDLRVAGSAPPWRYRACLSDAGVATIAALLQRHPVRSIARSTRPGIPDEACPSLMISDAAGQYSVFRWAGDGTPSFSAIVGFMNDLARVIEASTIASATGNA